MTTRTRWVTGLMVAAALTPAAARASVTHTAQYQGDAAHSGDVYGAGIAPPLRRAWTASTDMQNAYPVIDHGRVFALAQPGGGTHPERIEALRLSSGHLDWSRTLANASRPYLIADGGQVFAVAEVASPGSAQTRVWAFNERSGRVNWSRVLPGDRDSPSPPIAAGGTLFISTGGVGDDVIAVRERGDTVRWHVRRTEGSGIVLAGTTLVLAGVCGNSMGLSAATGAVRWHDNPGCDGGGTVMPSFGDGRVWSPAYAGGDTGPHGTAGEIYVPRTGAVRRTFLGYAPAFGDGEAVLTRTLNDGASQYGLAAIDPATSAIRWTFGGLDTAPLFADGAVFGASTDNEVVALKPCSGVRTWAASLPAPVDGTLDVQTGLAAGGGYLVVPTQSGLVAFRGTGRSARAPHC